jgi:hypothetical protein
VVVRNPWRPQVAITALSKDMRMVVALVLDYEDRDWLLRVLKGEDEDQAASVDAGPGPGYVDDVDDEEM